MSDPRLDVEEESPDAAELPGLDLTPRARPARTGGGRMRLWLWGAALLAIAGGGFLVIRNLAGATVFYYNVDEAVAQRSSLGTSTFRMQGTVACGSVKTVSDGVEFSVTYGGVSVPVHSVGSPPQLFQEGIPVLLEGSWNADGSRFSSSTPIVKHTEEYIEKNNDRLTEAGNPNDAKLTEGRIAPANLCGTA